MFSSLSLKNTKSHKVNDEYLKAKREIKEIEYISLFILRQLKKFEGRYQTEDRKEKKKKTPRLIKKIRLIKFVC